MPAQDLSSLHREGRYRATCPTTRRLFAGLLFTLAAFASVAECPPEPPPAGCDIDGQFLGGRWDISSLSGTYSFSGPEVFYTGLVDDYSVSGALSLEMLGGVADNYLDVTCDGTVTGQGHERISGTILKAEMVDYCPDLCINDPADMLWDVTIEREYTITGTVSGAGQLDLVLTVDTATISHTGNFADGIDSRFFSNSDPFSDFPIAGDEEEIRLAGAYDPASYTFQPMLTHLGPRSWLDDVLHRLRLNGQLVLGGGFWPEVEVNPSLEGPGSTQTLPQGYNTYFIQDTVTVTPDLEASAEATTPIITALELQEPAQYLSGIDIDTQVVATVDWRSSTGTQEVQFTYGATSETVPAVGQTVTWTFAAGEAGTTIEAVASAGDQTSQPYVINTPKVAVPGWAGAPTDWSATPGIQYDTTLDWPISLETTRTIDTLSLFAGLWGITGEASSELNATALSSGSPGDGDMATSASLQLAGRGFSFAMDGPNQTTLSCDELTVTGEATAQFPLASWQTTINPLTAIPGLSSAVCGLSGALCSVINSFGIQAEAKVTLTGTGTYTGIGAEISWDGGSVGGSISGKLSFSPLPEPLSKVANLSFFGGGTGCIEFEVAPQFQLQTLGGEIAVGASVSFFGLGTEVTESWPFGDGCASSIASRSTPTGWVPADGQLALAVTELGGDLVGAAVWTELPAGQARPSGDIRYRLFRNSVWGSIHSLTADPEADLAPAAAFDALGDLVIVYQRSEATLPTTTAELPAFANGFELAYAVVDSSTELVTAAGQVASSPVNDFGPRLRTDASGALHLFWQRANGIEIFGSASDPVSLHASSWSSVTRSWSPEETMANGLALALGWSPAALSADEMLVGLVVDTDDDLATADDRELLQISKSAGVWLSPVPVTTDLEADDAPQAAFDAAGQPALLWRSKAEVLELRAGLGVAPALAFTSADPAIDGGIGAGLAHGLVATADDGLVVVWPEGIHLELADDLDDGGAAGWTVPAALFGGEDAQTIQALAVSGDDLLVGYATQSFEPGDAALVPWLTPHIARIALHAEIFTDGFESGDVSAWSLPVP